MERGGILAERIVWCIIAHIGDGEQIIKAYDDDSERTHQMALKHWRAKRKKHEFRLSVERRVETYVKENMIYGNTEKETDAVGPEAHGESIAANVAEHQTETGTTYQPDGQKAGQETDSPTGTGAGRDAWLEGTPQEKAIESFAREIYRANCELAIQWVWECCLTGRDSGDIEAFKRWHEETKAKAQVYDESTTLTLAKWDAICKRFDLNAGGGPRYNKRSVRRESDGDDGSERTVPVEDGREHQT
jgi:ferric-dicitrate binding protein FerR (iron transport regulator)